MKTVFIIITRGFIVRNILRSGGLELIKKRNCRIVVFLLSKEKETPEYLKKELEDENVVLHSIPDARSTRMHRAVKKITTFLLYTDSTKRYLKYGNKRMISRSRYKTYLNLLFVRIISLIWFLKPMMRWVEITYFPEEVPMIKKYFDKYQPDLVFSSSVISSLDIAFMKEAKRRDVKTLSMPKGWDNVTRNYYRFIPDYMIVQNDILRKKTIEMQDMEKERVITVGFPQFDWYAKEDILRTREEHFARMGLDPKLPLIFFGSEGMWADQDYKIAEKIYDWIKNNKLVKSCQLLVRPHFSNVKEGKYLVFKGRERVVLDETFGLSDYFIDNWDPAITETVDFVNSLKHCNVLVTVVSTLNLDAACLDRPSVNIGYKCKFRKDKDITPWLYKSNHVQWVLKTGGVDVAWSEEELMKIINENLLNPEKNSEGRSRLRNELCYKVDGKSSERMVEVISNILDSKV